MLVYCPCHHPISLFVPREELTFDVEFRDGADPINPGPLIDLCPKCGRRLIDVFQFERPADATIAEEGGMRPVS